MKRKLTQIGFIVIDICIIVFAFLFVAWLKTGTSIYVSHYYKSICAFGAIWLGIGLWGQKFSIKQIHSGRSFAMNMLKTDMIAIVVVLSLIVLFQKFYYSRYIVFGTIALTATLEFLFFVGLYYALKFHKENDSFASATLVTKSKQLEEVFSDKYIKDSAKGIPVLDSGPYRPDFNTQIEEPLNLSLWQNYFSDNNALMSFLSDNLLVTNFSKAQTMILNSDTYFHISEIEPDSQQLFINLHKINDFRRINQYLIKVNANLVKDGVFVCCGETITERRNRFFKMYTPYFGVFAYFIDFVIRRACPKIPIVQGWYFALTQGKNRALSETEMIGRFYFCGFSLITKKDIDGLMHFILKKEKQPSHDPNPSYGPIIKLKRKGLNGKTIYISKFRTMHPYSEYLQDYVYKTSDLQEGGKFTNDFRITSWGKIFRTLWIDELPQLFSLLKGDVSLVGVRPLSEHYYELYPKDLQELRCKFKPGLVPPFYADMPKTFEDIVSSERIYLEKKQQHPFKTDWIYFWKVFWNIIFKHARSN